MVESTSSTAPEVPSTTRGPVTPGTAKEYTDALVRNFAEDPDNKGLLDATQAACVAPKWVEAVTPARFGKAGITPEDLAAQRSMTAFTLLDLTLPEAEGLVRQMRGCGVDVLERSLAAASSSGDETNPKVRACLKEKVSDDLMDRMVAVGLSGKYEDPTVQATGKEFVSVLNACGVYPNGGN